MDTTFRIRQYAKRELALKYFVGSEPRVAVNRLTRWINACRPLLDDLREAGYDPKAKEYNRRQVALIVKHFGEPDEDDLPST